MVVKCKRLHFLCSCFFRCDVCEAQHVVRGLASWIFDRSCAHVQRVDLLVLALTFEFSLPMTLALEEVQYAQIDAAIQDSGHEHFGGFANQLLLGVPRHTDEFRVDF